MTNGSTRAQVYHPPTGGRPDDGLESDITDGAAKAPIASHTTGCAKKDPIHG